MKIIFEVGHPAHVNTFRNIINILSSRGHKIMVVARDKDVTLPLLKSYNINYKPIGNHKTSLAGKFLNLFLIDFKYLCLARKFKPDLILSITSPYSAHISKLLNIPHLAFLDSEESSLILNITLPFVDVLVTPSAFKKRFKVKKHILLESYKELAYLHPKYFKPNPEVLKELGLKRGEKFFILRFVAWKASHDTRSKGISFKAKREIINLLEKEGKVFISSESELEPCLKKYKIPLNPSKFHSLLYYAQLYVGDGSTPAVESALLGTPAIHFEAYKSKSGKTIDISSTCGNIYELQKAGLLWTFCNEEKMVNSIKKILNTPSFKKVILKRLKTLLNKKIDVTKFMVELVEKELERKKD